MSSTTRTMPKPLTDAEYHDRAEAVLAPRREHDRPLAAGRRRSTSTPAHRRPARARLSERQPDRSSTLSRRCRSSGWPRAPAASTTAGRRPLARHARAAASSSTCCRHARASRPAEPLRFDRPDAALGAALSGGTGRGCCLRSSSLGVGAVGGGLSSRPRLLDAGAARVFLVVPLAADVDHALGRRRLLHRHALQRRLHVVDPDRQRQAAAGFAVAELARVVVAHPDDRDQRLAGSRRTRRRCESLVVPVLP